MLESREVNAPRPPGAVPEVIEPAAPAAAAPSAAPRHASRHRSPIAIAIAIAAACWIALAGWAVASPAGASPDDDYHLAMIYCNAGAADCTTLGHRLGTCFGMKPTVAADCAAGFRDRTIPSTTGVRAGHYPPLFYAAMTPFVGDTIGATTLNIRLVNVTLAVAAAALSVALSSRKLRPAVALSWLAAVPLGMYFLSSINPNAWSILAIAAMWGPLLSLLTAPRSSGAEWPPAVTRGRTAARAAFVLVMAFMALGARSESALWIPPVVAAVTIFALPWPIGRFWRDRDLLLRLILPVVLVAMSAVALVLFSGRKAEKLTDAATQASQDPNYHGWQIVQQTMNSLLGMIGFPGVPLSGLGTYDVPVPEIAGAAIVVALGGLCLFGIGVMYMRKALAFGGFTVVTVVAIAFLWSERNWEYFQPRYFLPMLFVFMGLALLPAPPRRAGAEPGRPVRITPLQLAVVFICFAVANAASLLSTMLRYLSGVTYQPSRDPLTQVSPIINPRWLGNAIPEWWLGPVGPATTWVIASTAFTLALVGLWLLMRRTPAASVD